ncbi:conserved hypothetical protein [Vibrio phage 249E41-1]|nr:conserved hypothetical protein [Vibrio phage 249E41-1]CAH9017516.1 conserved hypothetical protein [Vibrio phage 193E37-1]
MQLIRVLRYKGCIVKVFNNGMKEGMFPYEYRFKLKGEWVSGRTSHNSVKSCLKYCKQDIDCEMEDCR